VTTQAITALGVGDRPRGAGRAGRPLAPEPRPRRTTGLQDDLVTPFRGLERDNHLRPDSTVEKLAKLKPVFGKGEAATMTAGNSTPLTDGASAVLLASDEWAKAHGLEPLAYLVDFETAAVDYVHGARAC
jgi:acetyl-CoA acetyltransferase